MHKIQTYILLALLYLFPIQLLAWGDKGHALIAEVAFHYLSASTQNTVRKYLGDLTIQEAANWMDKIKSDPKNKFMSPWHYVNFERDSAVIETPGDNILSVLNKTVAELKHNKNLSDEEIKIRILYLFHLIGDLHQPLHIGYGNDKGGNMFQVNYKGKGSNLHSFWDYGIIENQNITLADCLSIRKYSESELNTLQKVDVVGWAVESRSFLDEIYNTTNKVEESYVNKNKIVIEEQILKAGIRLAGTLESIFGKS